MVSSAAAGTGTGKAAGNSWGTSVDGGGWELAVRQPAAALRGQVLEYRGYRMDLRHPRRRLEVPTAVVTMVLGFDGPMRLTDAVDPARTASFTSLIGGMRRTGTIGEHDGRLHGLAVSMTPRTAFGVFGPALGDLTNQWVDPADALGHGTVRRLLDQLFEAPGWDARARVMDAFLLSRLARSRPYTSAVDWAWRELRRTNGQVSVKELADTIGWSRRRLETAFREQVGLPPKGCARVLRLQHALREYRDSTDRDGARIATHCGYFDQAHLVREFRATLGCTPSQFFAHRSRQLGAEPADRLAGEVTTALLPNGDRTRVG
ncbi:helix-turn-helix domain-containing protein [Kitasatospora sp. NPDC051853]|uniref:helix-turn-helix domain-containing protein n=1 Tax=Kitasatospora sp. NPDC051853 TaxID=3364058 RepID=UPI00378BD9D1